MAAEENRLAHFRRLVESLSPEGKGGKPLLREGYRVVADEAGLTYDYVYQVYTGKSGKTRLGEDAVKKISKAFGKDKPADWMDHPVGVANVDHDFGPIRPPTLEEAWDRIAEALTSLDEIGREMAVSILTSLAKSPEKPGMSFQMLETLVRVHGRRPQDPPPAPTKTKKTTTSAPATRATGKAALVLKIGGGKKQQFNLPLTRGAFRSETAPANERAWYERVKAVPKASDEEKQ
jgi:hypothetical protein